MAAAAGHGTHPGGQHTLPATVCSGVRLSETQRVPKELHFQKQAVELAGQGGGWPALLSNA